MKVVLTDEAKVEVRQRRAWWKKYRVHKGLFNEELLRVRRELKHAPKLTVFGMREGLEVRRFSLSRVHSYAYYTINDEESLVKIISVWGQEQENQPDFVDD